MKRSVALAAVLAVFCCVICDASARDVATRLSDDPVGMLASTGVWDGVVSVFQWIWDAICWVANFIWTLILFVLMIIGIILSFLWSILCGIFSAIRSIFV